MTRDESRKLAAAANLQGGLTWNVRTRRTPQSGYAVSGNPERERKVAKLTPLALRTYVRDNADLLRLRVRDALASTHLGAWFDGETWYLDVVLVVEERRAALAVGRSFAQRAIYDLTNRETVAC